MKTITYYIGAGASYQSLPLVKTLGIRMKGFSRFLKLLESSGKITTKFTSDFIKHLDNIIDLDENNTSIDAYAKQLYNTSKLNELTILKCILSSYLSFEQLKKPADFKLYSDEMGTENSYKEVSDEIQKSVKNIIDKRYRTFWSEILTEKVKTLPPQLNIVSWNYDSQFETSYGEIYNQGISSVQ